MKNKISIMAVAVGLAVSGVAVAGGNHGVSVNSNSFGSVGSYSVVDGVNQTSVHGALATSNNQSSVRYDGGTVKVLGQEITRGATSAQTEGSTFTAAGGIGVGGSGAYAGQVGQADVEKTFKGKNTEVQLGSSAAVGTFSEATNVNGGLAVSGSNAGALNVSTGVATSTIFGATTLGGSAGVDHSSTWGGTDGGNETVNAGGLLSNKTVSNIGSAQNGFYDVTAKNKRSHGGPR